MIGPSCSGKSTRGAELARRLDARFVELDAIFWLADWQNRPSDEFRSLVREAVDTPGTWVVAGNYTSRGQDITWGAGDTMI